MTLFVWGSNDKGELGLNDEKEREKPVIQNTDLFNSDNLVQVKAGHEFSVALTKSGKVYCWGDNSNGELILKDSKKLSKVTHLLSSLLNKKIASISCGRNHSLAATIEGNVFSWGVGKYGKIGTRSEENCVNPKLILGLKNIIETACGSKHSLFLCKSGKVYSCGFSGFGATGLKNLEENKDYPCEIIFHEIVIKISANQDCSLAINENHVLYQWGTMYKNETFKVNNPARISYGKVVKACCGSWSIFYITEEGNLFSFFFFGKWRSTEIRKSDFIKKIKNTKEGCLKFINVEDSYM